MNRPPSTSRRSSWLYAATAVAVGTAAALLWLHEHNQLAATGLAIYRLDTRRQELLEVQALWLEGYERSTDPQVLAQRARSMGFGPPPRTAYVALDGLPAASVASGNLGIRRAGSPLAMVAPSPHPLLVERGLWQRWFGGQGAVVASAGMAADEGGLGP